MSVTTIPERPVKKWRVIVFAVVAALFALVFLVVFYGIPTLLLPWIPGIIPLVQGSFGGVPPEEHWHLATLGVLLCFLFAGSIIALLWHGERRPGLAQFLLLALLGFGIMNAIVNPSGIIVGIVIIGILILAYPAPRALFSFTREGAWNLPFLALSIFAAICLAPDVWHSMAHAMGTTNSTTQTSWLIPVVVDCMLVIGGVLAAAKQPGWQNVGLLSGVSFLYLGATALLVPGNAGSWGIIGGILGIVGGLGFIAATVYEMYRTKQRRQERGTGDRTMAGSHV